MQLAPLQPLQHRRDVAGLCVTYKILKQGAPHLAITPAAVGDNSPILHRGRQQERPTTHCSLRQDSDLLPLLPAAIQRAVEPLVRQTDMHQAATLHIFKCAVNPG
ncbi:hypothetical protein GWK47_041336 [Chionoecetes opilio]|uniref:Uncharacterized protein n=1 Tax=Chionoecetes opilio TaxID=41210 RepID=A0A8J4YP37_CHIOP|nr:hypothetical protein GWK47_041336 [Chionoecetes opilio]